jgi:bacterioferritin-associated ferredoxin
MYVCLCNPFTDKDIKSALDNPSVRNTPAQVYKACSGGVQPCCGSCVCMIKDMIVEHQSARGVQKIIEDMPALEPIAAE